MDAEDFFSRWSRRAAEAKAAQAQESAEEGKNASQEGTPAPAFAAEQRPVTLEDVASLTNNSDYTPFMAKGVDEAVKRSAMKKLFSDPHFNVMDGLDIYIDDYSVFEPLSPATLLAMNHAKPLLDPLKQIQSSMLSLLQESDEQKESGAIKDAIEQQGATAHAAMEQEITQDSREQAVPETAKEQENGSIAATLACKQAPADMSNPTKPAEQ